MDKIDFKKRDRALYQPPAGRFVPVDVPPLPYLMVDGRGDPNTAPAYLQAVQWLYSVSYALKFALKAEGRDYVVPPLEALWSAEDPASFIARRKDEWAWTVMIRTPEGIGPTQWQAAISKARTKLGMRRPASAMKSLPRAPACRPCTWAPTTTKAPSWRICMTK